ncbi:hypothetical protein ACH4MA_23900 [Streptomyces roseolus]|uniref:hypothetical protein n=1 Tax=Streptomyces roseolus TaxID=67358 RepID=UPI0037B8A4AE
MHRTAAVVIDRTAAVPGSYRAGRVGGTAERLPGTGGARKEALYRLYRLQQLQRLTTGAPALTGCQGPCAPGS